MHFEQQGGRVKDFLILLVSVFFIYTYNTIFMMATPLLLISMGSTEIIAGLQGALFLVAAVLLRFFFGPFADAYGRRLVMLLGSSSFFFAAVLFFYAVEVWQVVALRLVQAVGLASYFPAALATAAACAGSGQRGTYIGVLRMVSSLSLMVGPVFALMYIQNYSYSLFFKSMAALAFLGMVALFFISARLIGPQKQVLKEKDLSLRQRINFLPLLKKCPLLVCTTFITALSYGIYISFAISFVVDYTKVDNAGFFFTLFSLGGIIANFAFGWLSDRFGRLRLTVCAFLSLGSGMILFALLPQMISFFYPAGLLAGAGYYGSTAVLMAWMTERVEAHEHTTALSLQQNALDFGIAAGSGGFGILLVAVGNAGLLYGVLGALYLCYGMLCAISTNRQTLLDFETGVLWKCGEEKGSMVKKAVSKVSKQ